jgi:putative ABC transport system substrate-binding protein
VGKWLETLKQVAPHVKQVAVLQDPTVAIGTAQFKEIEKLAPRYAVEATPVDVRDRNNLERGITSFAHEAHGDGGLVITASTYATVHRDLIVLLAARERLPAVYPTPFYVASGGLISYGPVFLDQYRRAADYVDRILKGAKPGDLPVQGPVRFENRIGGGPK